MTIALSLLLLLGSAAVEPPTPQDRMGTPNANWTTQPHVPNIALGNLPPGLGGPDTFLAFKVGGMYAVRGYKIEGDRIWYRNSFGGENTMPVSSLDMERTQKLNADQQISFGPR